MQKSKLFGVLSSAVLFGSLLTGCGEAEVTKVDNGSAGTEEKAEKKEEKKTEFKIGETVSIDGMEITLSSVAWGKANEYTPAEKGKVLRIEGNVKNNGAENGFIDNTEFQVYAGDQATDFYFGSEDANMLSGELKQGKTSNIVLEFDVPEADTYEIYYEPSFTLKENSEVKWIVPAGEIK